MPVAMLKKEEELALARDWRDNASQKARAKLLQSYQPLIRSIASRHMRNGLDKEDLIQEGNMGFMAGLDNFDPDLGHSVGTLARFHIAARMQIYISEFTGILRLPNSRRIKGLLTKCVGGIRQAESLIGRELTDQEKEAICQEAGFSLLELQEYERVMRPVKSLSAPVSTEEETGFELPDETTHDDLTTKARSMSGAAKVLLTILDDMPERTKHIIVLRHMNDEFVSLEDIATELGLSRERVRRIEIDGLSQMKTKLEEMGLGNISDII